MRSRDMSKGQALGRVSIGHASLDRPPRPRFSLPVRDRSEGLALRRVRKGRVS
jgi:hypothetical protein